jgi:hypothetical protein
MKRVLCGLVLILSAVGFGAVPAWADLDQRCLSQCVNGGGFAAKCLPECTYNDAQKSGKSSDTLATSTHDVFVAPKPAGNEILLPAQAAKNLGPDKDYACVNQCLHDGGQYDRCSQHCTKRSCTLGGNGCTGLPGAASSKPPASTAGP